LKIIQRGDLSLSEWNLLSMAIGFAGMPFCFRFDVILWGLLFGMEMILAGSKSPFFAIGPAKMPAFFVSTTWMSKNNFATSEKENNNSCNSENFFHF